MKRSFLYDIAKYLLLFGIISIGCREETAKLNSKAKQHAKSATIKGVSATSKKSLTSPEKQKTKEITTEIKAPVTAKQSVSKKKFAAVDPEYPLVPGMNVNIDQKHSIVYCATFQLAWDKLVEIFGEPIRMENESVWVSILNNSPIADGIIDKHAYIAMSGFVKHGIVDKFRLALQKKFGKSAPRVPIPKKNIHTVFYAYLQQQLYFYKKFAASTDQSLKFHGKSGPHKVMFFKCSRGEYSSSVEIVHYKDKHEFTLRLRTRSKSESVILAKMKAKGTLADIAMMVKKQMAERRFFRGIQPGDLLAIPMVKVNIEANYNSLRRRFLKNTGHQGNWIETAWQRVEFEMNESGAKLKSFAMVEEEPFSEDTPQPRSLVFDEPFFLALWRQNADWPYLAMWINDVDVLVPADNKLPALDPSKSNDPFALENSPPKEEKVTDEWDF